MVVDVDLGQHLLVPVASARVLVHHVDQFADGVLPVAHHAGGGAFGGGHELVVDHQQAVVQPGDEALHDGPAAHLLGLFQGRHGLVPGLDADGGPTTVVAPDGLDHAGVADPVEGLGQSLLGAHHPAARHGDLVALEQLLGLLLVAGDLHPDVARAAGDGGADALLVNAVAQLHQAL